MTSREQYLAIYLQDHDAAAVGGIELVRRMIAENKGNIFGDTLIVMADELEANHQVLRKVLEALNISPSRSKTTATWVGEKLSRLKLNGQITGYSPLSRLIELDGLNEAVVAQQSLWRTLKRITDAFPALEAFDLEALEQRAQDQLERLRRLQADAADLLFYGERREEAPAPETGAGPQEEMRP